MYVLLLKYVSEVKCLILSITAVVPLHSQSYRVVSFTILPGRKDVIVFLFHGQPSESHTDCGLSSEQGFFPQVSLKRHIQLPYLLNMERHLKSLNT